MSFKCSNLLKIVCKTSQVRYVSRWNHRKPKKVYSAEEYEQIEGGLSRDEPPRIEPGWKLEASDNKDFESSTPLVKTSFDFKARSSKVTKPLIASYQKSEATKSTTKTDMFQTVFDSDGQLVYTKMKDNDARVGIILTEIKSKKEQDKKNLILLEGNRLIKDAIISGCVLKYILFSRKADLMYIQPFLPKIGINLYKMPYRELQMWSDLSTSPGIMAICNTPKVEEYQPKASIPLTIVCDNIREPGNLGAVLRIAAGVGCKNVLLTKGCVNLWDTKVLRSAVGAHFKLAIKRNLEWDQVENAISSTASCFIADNKIICESDTNNEDVSTLIQTVPIVPYYGVDFGSIPETVLIVGGETHGLSQESYKLVDKRGGGRLNIPLMNDIDSLNVGTALGIIVFEIKKQIAAAK